MVVFAARKLKFVDPPGWAEPLCFRQRNARLILAAIASDGLKWRRVPLTPLSVAHALTSMTVEEHPRLHSVKNCLQGGSGPAACARHLLQNRESVRRPRGAVWKWFPVGRRLGSEEVRKRTAIPPTSPMRGLFPDRPTRPAVKIGPRAGGGKLPLRARHHPHKQNSPTLMSLSSTLRIAGRIRAMGPNHVRSFRSLKDVSETFVCDASELGWIGPQQFRGLEVTTESSLSSAADDIRRLS